ncbi:hypothetical protein QL285_061940 [Trifolium repens]|nr:hypothetical protein QL285_061940 [Trifolium repens]
MRGTNPSYHNAWVPETVGPTPTKNTQQNHKVKVDPLPQSHPMVHSRNHVSNSTKSQRIKVDPLPQSHPMVHSRNHVLNSIKPYKNQVGPLPQPHLVVHCRHYALTMHEHTIPHVY